MNKQRHAILNAIDSSKCDEILKAYKKLSTNPNNQHDLLKDKTVLLFIATLLDCQNDEVIQLCIEILQDFINFNKYHKAMQNSFTLFKAINTLAIKLRKEKSDIAFKVNDIMDKMSHSMLSYSKEYCYTIDLPDLNEETRYFYENVFLSIKGIVCWGTDLESKCCVIRIYRTLTILQILDKLKEELGVTPFLRFSYDLETKDSIKANNDETDKLEHKFKMTYVNTKIMQAIRKLVDIWNRSFYWQ